MNGVVSFHVYWWGIAIYSLIVVATIAVAARVAYRFGHAVGYAAAKSEQPEPVQAPRFRQRTAEADPRRQTTVRRARMLARRQPKPEPRRGIPRRES